jgi:CBS domain-containing protein
MKRNVFSVSSKASIREAAFEFVAHHIGLLPVVNETGKLVGVVGLRDLLTLEMPDFFELLPELDFVHDFGAVETTRPTAAQLNRPVTVLMQPATSVLETGGLLLAYALMLKHHLHDLPVISEEGKLVGIASRVDIGSAILETWKTIGSENA